MKNHLKLESLKKVHILRRAISLSLLCVLGLFIAALVFGKIGRYKVISGSMLPTLQIGDFVIADQRASKEYEREDVIVFNDPDNAKNEQVTKRIIGLPGETLVFEKDRILIGELAYDVPKWKMRLSEFRNKSLTLADDEIFVLGDNQENSHDSLYFGPLNTKFVFGRVLMVYWPPSHFGQINSVPTLSAREDKH